jgi:DNA excision repair protein ERCC-4
MGPALQSNSPGARSEDPAIVLDSQEQPSGLPALVEARWERVSVRRLPVGDVSIGRVLVERKEAHDFVISLRSGRLFGQAYKLKAASSRPLVVLEGDPYSLVAPHQVSSLKGALLCLLTGYGIPVLRTRDLEATADNLVRIAHQERRRGRRRARDREIDRTVPLDRRLAPAPSRKQRTLALLEALPGVGPARARALLRRFGSLDQILNSDPAELVGVPGIGATTATRILSALLRTASSFRSPAPDEAEGREPDWSSDDAADPS